MRKRLEIEEDIRKHIPPYGYEKQMLLILELLLDIRDLLQEKKG